MFKFIKRRCKSINQPLSIIVAGILFSSHGCFADFIKCLIAKDNAFQS